MQRVIVLIGPQGSGKGTQADALAAKLGAPVVSVGQLLRREVDIGTEVGHQIEATLKAGERVFTPIVSELVEAALKRMDLSKGVIFDGFPRAYDQVAALEKVLLEHKMIVTDVVYLAIPDTETRRRLQGRLVCSNPPCAAKYHVDVAPPKVKGICDRCGEKLITRADDTPEAITRRLQIYHSETTPILEEYRQKGLVREVDGVGSVEEVTGRVFSALGDL